MLELYSKKKKKAKFIGQVVISTKEFVLDKLIEISREIQPPPSCENHKYLVSGKIQMKLFKSHNSRVFFHLRNINLKQMLKCQLENVIKSLWNSNKRFTTPT